MITFARAIILKDYQMLVMERHKMGQHYYTLLGGKVEKGENSEVTAVREVLEESGVQINNPRLVFIEDGQEPFGRQYVYLCDYVSGEPSLPPESEEAYWTTEGKNTYTPKWIDIKELNNIPFVSPLLKEAILMGLTHGFPKDVYRFSSKHSSRLS